MDGNDVEAKGLTEGSDGFVRCPLAITISKQARDQSRAGAQGSPVKGAQSREPYIHGGFMGGEALVLCKGGNRGLHPTSMRWPG